MWPNSRISVMGGDQAASVLSQVKKDQLEAKGEVFTEAMRREIEDPVRTKYEEEGNPFFSTARLWDDGILDPRQTRDALALALAATLNAPIPDYDAPVFRM